ncbi:MAG: NAD-dependent epimerase/dehydratase family protein [Alphaproteobacteria bacterium]|jgi:nucleoside-diphosphate-sugar epimerase|nr:NAD-dependent epimerase/dehydratase family protein [Alphaproteobacteria bacterium]
MKKIIITGGTGFVAGFVIAEFLNNGYMVHTSVRDIKHLSKIKLKLADYVDSEKIKNLSAFVADLTQSEGWVDGIRGADGIIHVASPMPKGTETVDELCKAAVDGTINILSSALLANISRIVMTSSQAASTAMRGETGVLNDDFWTDEKNPDLDPYRISKIRAERAAWDFANKNNIQLTTILAGAIFGPAMSTEGLSSNAVLLNLLNGNPKRIINIPLEVVDVRDLATLHRLAFENDKAIGQRFLSSEPILKMTEIAEIYRKEFPKSRTAYKVYPDFIVRILAKFKPELRTLIPILGRCYTHTNKRAKTMLNWTLRNPKLTVIDAAKSFEKLGLIEEK